jgi:hypothetical protein
MRTKQKAAIIVLSMLALIYGAFYAVGAVNPGRHSVFGAGRIGEPVPGETVASSSDFGFAVDEDGGTFVCSMAGSETGGFAGFQVMLVEGPVTPGSINVHGRNVSFSGKATVALIPGLSGVQQTVLNEVDYNVNALTGKEGRGQMIKNGFLGLEYRLQSELTRARSFLKRKNLT